MIVQFFFFVFSYCATTVVLLLLGAKVATSQRQYVYMKLETAHGFLLTQRAPGARLRQRVEIQTKMGTDSENDSLILIFQRFFIC